MKYGLQYVEIHLPLFKYFKLSHIYIAFIKLWNKKCVAHKKYHVENILPQEEIVTPACVNVSHGSIIGKE